MDAAALSSRGASFVHASDWTRVAMACVVAIGLALRLVQYISGGSLWMDELALARNVVDRDWSALVGEPLGFGQVTPVGFLLAQKIVVTTLGSDHDAVLRIVPFLAAVASLMLFWRLADRSLGSIGSLVAMMLFATAMPLVFFATQAKQYSTDILSSTLVMLTGALLDSPRLTRRQLVTCALDRYVARIAVLGARSAPRDTGNQPRALSGYRGWGPWLIGAMVVWLSYPALLVVGVTGIVVLVRAVWRAQHWTQSRQVAYVVALWGASALASLTVAMSSVSPDVRLGMMEFWSGGFPPASDPVTTLRWFLTQLETILGAFGTASLRYPAPLLYGALGGFGALALLWRRHLLGQIAVGVGVAALAAAVTEQYPFAQRLALYLVPLGLLLIAAGVDAIHAWLARHARDAAVFAPLLVVPCLLPVVQSPPPYQLENVHPMLRHLQRNRQPADRIYVYYGAMLAFDFYAARYGFANDTYTAGTCHRPDNREYLQEIDALRGVPRVWVFFSHAVPRYGDRDDLIGYLDTIGRRVQRVSHEQESGPPDVELYLYDLSDPARLARSDAMHYDVKGPEAPVPPCAPRVPLRMG